MDLCEVENLMKSLVISSPHDLTIENLNKDFENEIGYSIPFKRLGYVSLQSLISSLHRTFVLLKIDGKTCVKVVSSKKSKHIEFMISAQRKRKPPRRPRGTAFSHSNIDINYKNIENSKGSKTVNFRSFPKSVTNLNQHKITSRVKFSQFTNFKGTEPQVQDVSKDEIKTTNQFEKHVTAANFVHLHRKNKNECSDFVDTKNYKEKNLIQNQTIFRNVENMYSENLDRKDSNIKESKNSGDCSVFKENIPIFLDDFHSENLGRGDSNIKESETSEDCSVFKENIPIFLDDFPKDVALLGDKIPAAVHMPNLPLDSQFCLYISEVHNPYKLWFHMEESSKELDDLMFKIELFNKNLGESQEYNMHSSNMNPNQLCLALYNNYWHRAQILQIPTKKFVKVYFVDYGTVDYIRISSIRYIHKDFIKLPSQVYRGCLAFLKPTDMQWQRDCTYFLLHMIYEKKLWAKLENFDETDQIYHFTIIDTNTQIDININKLLIIKGYAKPCNIDSNKTHFQYIYPTFDMLENGEYPSFEEIGKLAAKGNDYEDQEYKTLKSINSKKIYGYSTLEFWNFIKNF